MTGPEECFVTLWLDESHILSLIGIVENHSERKPEEKYSEVYWTIKAIVKMPVNEKLSGMTRNVF